jgi:single-strand DNA-binding protein
MARSFNQVILMGNLTRDPELRTTPNGTTVCSFSLALNRSYKGADGNWIEATDFIDIVAWGPALVNGRLQSRSWEQDGAKRSKVEVVAQDVTFLGGGERGSGGGATSHMDSEEATPAKKKSSKKDDQDVVIEDIGDEPINLDDIPF